MRARKASPGGPASRSIGAVLTVARGEAERARHGYLGVEHLLLTLAQPTAPVTRQLLAEHGVTLDRARDAVWLVVGSGRGDGPRFDPATLLATLGIDLDQIRRQVERQLGSDAIDRLYASEAGWDLRPRGPLCGLPLAPSLKKALSDALGRCWDNTPQCCTHASWSPHSTPTAQDSPPSSTNSAPTHTSSAPPRPPPSPSPASEQGPPTSSYQLSSPGAVSPAGKPASRPPTSAASAKTTNLRPNAGRPTLPRVGRQHTRPR
jgi:hypothetical protein